MLIRYARKYIDYLVERLCAIGEVEIAALDMSELTMHYYSTGCCDPIEPIGLRPAYTVKTIDVPDWLIDGMRHNAAYCGAPEQAAVRLMLNELRANDELEFMLGAVRELAYLSKPGKFQKSLMTWWSTHGWLSPKQATACYPRRHYRH